MKLKHFLLTALILFTGVSGVYAEKHYVGFTSGNTNGNDLQTALTAAQFGGDTVFVAAGLYLATTTEFTVPEGVTLIGGYDKGDNINKLTRRYPGQFVPFVSSVVDTFKFTVLDGNSLKRTLHTEKHRVITVKENGVVDGCLIRNGHIRNGNGGGVFLDGGKLYNSIVRGNVAMNHPDSAEALGGGVFIQKGGELINCLIAYNMANDGYGVAAGTGGGRMINNTITANTYSPVFAKIPGTGNDRFQMYEGSYTTNFRGTAAAAWPGDSVPKWSTRIKLNDFYLSRTPITEGQYAVFCAAVDLEKVADSARINVGIFVNLPDPTFSGNIGTHYGFSDNKSLTILQSSAAETEAGLKYANGIWYPHLDTASVEYPMGHLNWFGALAYSVWLGGGLPSEAQWEFAARRNPAGYGKMVNENLYSGAYGSSYAASNGKNDNTDTATWRVLDTIAWVASNRSIDTGTHKYVVGGTTRVHEVARKRPNAMGIYDMTGNISEWCGDWYTDPDGINPYSSSTVDNPMNTTINGSLHRSRRGESVYNITTRENAFLGKRSGGNVARALSTDVGNGVRPVVAF